MLKNPPSFVLTSLKSFDVPPWDKSLSWQAWGGRVKWYASASRSLRPRWTVFLNILQAAVLIQVAGLDSSVC